MRLDAPYPEADQWPGLTTISVSPVALDATTPFHTLPPLRFPPGLRLTPEQLAFLCAENREAVLELAADGSLIVMSPTGSETGTRNFPARDAPAFSGLISRGAEDV